MKKFFTTMLLLTTLLTMVGCNDKETFAYTGKESIQVETTSVDKVARITITDSYTKDGEAYYIIESDVSGGKEWTLSASEYDRLIGAGNDAVDCKVYVLKCKTNIFSYSCNKNNADLWLQTGGDIGAIIDKLDNISTCAFVHKDYCHISKAFGIDFRKSTQNFDDYGYEINITGDENGLVEITGEVTLYRYSFAGETAFTEEDIEVYKEVIHKVNSELVPRFREEIHNDKWGNRKNQE